MEYPNKLIPIKTEDSVYYAYPTKFVNADIRKFINSFKMEKPTYTKNPKFKNKKEILDEVRQIPGAPILRLPRYMGESLARGFNIPIKPWQAPGELQHYDRNIEFLLQPRVGQNEVFMKTIEQLDDISGVTLKLNTGHGKTWIVSKIIWHYWRDTIIFVPNKDLQNQVCLEVSSLLGDIPVCKAGGSAKTKDVRNLDQFLEGNRESDIPFICVAVGKTANNLCISRGAHIWNKFYLSVYDECQTFCSDTGINLLKYCQTTKKIALSANPGKNWNSQLIYMWCGPVVDGDLIMPKKNIKGEVKIIKYYGPKFYSESQTDSRGTNNFIDTLHLIEKDEARVQLGIAEIRELHLQNLVPVVFFQHVDYLLHVAKTYDQAYHTSVGILIGATPDPERIRIKAESEVIFTTYKFGGIGLNAPRIKSMVLMQPHKTLGQQVNGRPLRDESDTVRKYVDFVDMVSFLGGQLRTRMEDYNARCFDIKIIQHRVQK